MLPIPIHDPTSLYAARHEIEKARAAIARLRQVDPTIRVLLADLGDMVEELTVELGVCALPMVVAHPVLVAIL
ncbi:MAG: hypothetical protein KGL39_44945 [Patescibacteria group bacterium]|nr:hypothetical protein [Patescibacteria group bacterium]